MMERSENEIMIERSGKRRTAVLSFTFTFHLTRVIHPTYEK